MTLGIMDTYLFLQGLGAQFSIKVLAGQARVVKLESLVPYIKYQALQGLCVTPALGRMRDVRYWGIPGVHCLTVKPNQ